MEEFALICQLLLVLQLPPLQLKSVAFATTGPLAWSCIVDSDHDGWLEYIFQFSGALPFPYHLDILEYHPVNRYELVKSDTGIYPGPLDSVVVGNVWPTAAGDIDGDGKTDLIGNAYYRNSNGEKCSVCVIENPDSDSYPDSIVWWDSLPQSGGSPRAIQLADMDRDGRREIIQPWDGTMVFENVADNRESLVYYAPPGTDCNYAIDDFDQNGKTDYAVFRYSQIRISECIGDNQYAVVCSLNPGQIDCRQLWMGNDVDKNGRPEFFATFVWPGSIRDTVSLYMFEAFHEHEYTFFRIDIDFIPTFWAGYSLCADLDGDGVEELVWATDGSRVHILKATAPHQFERVCTWWNNMGSKAMCNASDFNANGYNELVVSGVVTGSGGREHWTLFLEVEAIRVLYPDRVRALHPGDTCRIRWWTFTPPRCDSVSLFLLTDTVVPEGERFWHLDTIATGLAPTESSYSWVVPDTTIGWAKVVAIAYGPGWQFDCSDSAFRIVPVGMTEGKPLITSGWSLNVYPSFGSVRIHYDVPEPSFIRLSLYDATGRLVKTLISREQKPGSYMVVWDGRDGHNRQVANGVYFYRLDGPGIKDTKKTVLMR